MVEPRNWQSHDAFLCVSFTLIFACGGLESFMSGRDSRDLPMLERARERERERGEGSSGVPAGMQTFCAGRDPGKA